MCLKTEKMWTRAILARLDNGEKKHDQLLILFLFFLSCLNSFVEGKQEIEKKNTFFFLKCQYGLFFVIYQNTHTHTKKNRVFSSVVTILQEKKKKALQSVVEKKRKGEKRSCATATSLLPYVMNYEH